MEREEGKRKFSIKGFEGPLDLLWHLIKENQLNIYDIPILEITEQYLEYLDHCDSTNLQELSEFYKYAALLLRLKTRLLLPAIDGEDLEAELLRDDLIDTLIEYQKYKKLTTLMQEREEESVIGFDKGALKNAFDIYEETLDTEEEEDIEREVSGDSKKLLKIIAELYKTIMLQYKIDGVLDMSEGITINEKSALLLEVLGQKRECFFDALLTRRGNKMDIVCAFMAILEGVKTHFIKIIQEVAFGKIKILKEKREEKVE